MTPAEQIKKFLDEFCLEADHLNEHDCDSIDKLIALCWELLGAVEVSNNLDSMGEYGHTFAPKALERAAASVTEGNTCAAKLLVETRVASTEAPDSGEK